MSFEERVTESGETRITEDGLDNRILETGGNPLPTITYILKWDQIGASDTRERPAYNYEFPTQLYMVISDTY